MRPITRVCYICLLPPSVYFAFTVQFINVLVIMSSLLHLYDAFDSALYDDDYYLRLLITFHREKGELVAVR